MTKALERQPRRSATTGRTVRRLGEPATCDRRTAGGKAAALADLLRRGFPVPRGFLIPAGAEIREAEIVEAYRALGRGVPVAVRSSGATEDGAGASRAGEFLTRLDVTGGRAVVQAVLDCRRQAENRGESMAVLVQPMVPADVSGVVFTADPVTGETGRIRVAAVPGPGGVVEGEDAEEAVLDPRDGRVLEGRCGLLPEGLRARLAALAVRVERERGAPQDIEWAVAGQKLVLLQARPVTALRPPLPEAPEGHRLAFPGRISPFGRSLEAAKLEVYNRAVREHTGRDAEYGQVERDGYVFETVRWRRRPLRETLHLLRALAPGSAGIRAFRRRAVPAYLKALRTLERRIESVRDVREAAELLAETVRTYFRFQADSLRVALAVERFPLLYRRAMSFLAPGSDPEAWLSGTARATRRRDELLSRPGAARDRGVLREVGYQLVPGNPKDPGRDGLRRPAADARPAPAPRPEPAVPPLPGGALRGRVLGSLLGLARAHHSFREEKNHLFYRGAWTIRHALVALGRSLAERGILPEPADAALLTLEEATDEAGEGEAGFARIALGLPERRRRAASRTRRPAARTPRSGSGARLAGRPGAPGRASGPARIVRGPEDFAAVRDGDVVVVPRFRPFFTPLLARAAAVVAEEGTALSHAATLAREYGVPAVVGVAGATDGLADGEIVTVDGAHGTVRREGARCD